MSILSMQNIHKSFSDQEVLKGVSLDLKETEVLAILGPSGSGKSTLMRSAAFLETIDEGEILYFGQSIIRRKKSQRLSRSEKRAENLRVRQSRSAFGFVFQNFNLFPHRTLIQNIMDPTIQILGLSKEESEARAEKLIKKMNLQGREKAYPSQLSGGQAQRVAIARALAMEPQLLFFDEPTSALDPELTGDVLKVLQSLAEEKMTLMIVTHEMDFAAMVADRAIFMDQGKVIEEGPAKELIKNPEKERTQQFLQKLKGL